MSYREIVHGRPVENRRPSARHCREARAWLSTGQPGNRAFGADDVDAAADPSLVGHRLAQLRQAQNITPEQQAEALGIDRERLTTLCSCRLPRDQAELKLIAARLGWEVGRLAGLLGVHSTGDAGS